jgi:hypothetical protein
MSKPFRTDEPPESADSGPVYLTHAANPPSGTPIRQKLTELLDTTNGVFQMAAIHGYKWEGGSLVDPIMDLLQSEIQQAQQHLLDRVEAEVVGTAGKIAGYMRPNGNPTVDLTQSYYNSLRTAQRQALNRLRDELGASR